MIKFKELKLNEDVSLPGEDVFKYNVLHIEKIGKYNSGIAIVSATNRTTCFLNHFEIWLFKVNKLVTIIQCKNQIDLNRDYLRLTSKNILSTNVFTTYFIENIDALKKLSEQTEEQEKNNLKILF